MERVKDLETFLSHWAETAEGNKKAFLEFKEWIFSRKDVIPEFIPRHGVTYSLRAIHPNPTKRALIALVDVIEDQPRWLSVCFYADMVSDPDEKGDFVPRGLLGEDAICFDVAAYDHQRQAYLKARLEEALPSADHGNGGTPCH